MKTYARIQNGVVMEIIAPMSDGDGNEIPVAERFYPAIVVDLVDITNLSSQPSQYWTYDGTTFKAPA